MSITFFFSSALSLPAIRCPDNFSSKSWLCIPKSIASHQSFVSLSKKPFNLNGQLHFLEPMPSRFGFFLVVDALYIPLLSHCIVKYGLFITYLSIHTKSGHYPLSTNPIKQLLSLSPFCICCKK